MVKAHSLLYAIYICLIVSIICAAMLYFSTLFGQLNQFYNRHEAMFLHNQSLVNYAIGNKLSGDELPADETGMSGRYESKPYGLLTLLLAHSISGKDTVSSAHFAGAYGQSGCALYLAGSGKGLSYSGKVTIDGDAYLPTSYISSAYVNGAANLFEIKGKQLLSGPGLPALNPVFEKVFAMVGEKSALAAIDKPNDSLFFNSFFNPVKEIQLSQPSLGKLIFKGNLILRSKDSIVVTRGAVLEDVILMAPRITFETGFSGTVQAFATESIRLGEKTTLHYPSVICLYNKYSAESKVIIAKGSVIDGSVVMFGNGTGNEIEKHHMIIEESGHINGDIYCTGKLLLRSDVTGSVYTNRFYYETGSSGYENLIANVALRNKLPDYYVAVGLFEPKSSNYGLIKKVL